MNIYTKTGDTGYTSLIGGSRVAKNHPRVEAYGHVDELISAIGVVQAHLTGTPLSNRLRPIQEELMLLSAHLASDGTNSRLTPVKQEAVIALEREIDLMQKELPPLTSFILPGPPIAAAHCQLARTVCRRTERAIIAIDSNEIEPEVLTYLNRLSDFLFVFGRYLTQQQGGAEQHWIPNF